MSKKIRDHHGENHPRHRLTNTDITQIRLLYSKGIYQCMIADQYHISQSWVSKICSGHGWGHLKT